MEYARGTGPDDWSTEARFRSAKPADPIMVEGFGALPIATETFGPLEMYGVIPESRKQYNANDNVPVSQQPARMEDDPAYREFERLANEHGVDHATSARTPWQGRPSSLDSGPFNGDNDHMEKTPEERLPGALALLASAPGYIYLGSPYSKYEAGHDAAARVVADAAARLMHRGMVIYSPIAHGHAVAAHGLPLDWAFWKRQCQPMIDAASALVVLTMHGWQESVGLQYEIEEFVRQAKPILHVSPAWLVENEWEVGRVA